MRPPGSKGLDLDGLSFCEDATPLPAVLLARRHHANPRVQVLLVVPVKERLKVRPHRLANIRGNSYRLKDKLKAGLVKPVEATTASPGEWGIFDDHTWGKLGDP